MVLWDADSLRFKGGTSQGVAALNVVTAQGVRKKLFLPETETRETCQNC